MMVALGRGGAEPAGRWDESVISVDPPSYGQALVNPFYDKAMEVSGKATQGGV